MNNWTKMVTLIGATMTNRTIIVWAIVLTVVSLLACAVGTYTIIPTTNSAANDLGAHLGTGIGWGLVSWGVGTSVLFTILTIIAAIRVTFLVRKGY